ncbi:MAG: hypothetical protein ACREKA_11385, partial [Candidatus Methylomirabilales bacterium]
MDPASTDGCGARGKMLVNAIVNNFALIVNRTVFGAKCHHGGSALAAAGWTVERNYSPFR